MRYSRSCWLFLFCLGALLGSSQAYAQSNLCRAESGHAESISTCDNPSTDGTRTCATSFYKRITFATPFAQPPHILVTPARASDGSGTPCSRGATDKIFCQPTEITTTGFKLLCSGSPESGTCGASNARYTQAKANWMAFDSRSACQALSAHQITPNTCPGTNVSGLCSANFRKSFPLGTGFSKIPDFIAAPENVSAQGGCVGGATDALYSTISVEASSANIASSIITLASGGSPDGSCNSYEGYRSLASVGYLGVVSRESCNVASARLIETDTCPGSLVNGTCSLPFRKTIVFPKAFSSPPQVIVSPEHVSSGPSCARGATDAVECRVVPGSITTTGLVVMCSGSPEGTACGTTQEGWFTRAKFSYLAIDTQCSIAQCQDGLDNDGDGLTDSQDPGCRTNSSDPNTYDPQRNAESDATTQCQDTLDNDGDTLKDNADPGCWTDPRNPATYDRTRNNEASATTQCQDGLDNDGNGLTDAADPGCSSPSDNSEGGGQLQAPTNLQASDNDRNGITITWNAVSGAQDYKLYRSEQPNDQNPALFPLLASPTSNSFFDASAVPGRIYNYAVKASLASVLSNFSNVDQGRRPTDIVGGDSDGDGVSDGQEGIDGTDPLDSGSFALHLKSPSFTKYNTYLSQSNFLELVADGTLPVSNAKVTVYSIQGQVVGETIVNIPAQTQVDVDINVLARQKDTYGVVKIEFADNIDGSTLKGRISNYRPDPAASTYSFAFTKELRNPTRGDTYASGNTNDPQGMGFLVPNWMEVINLDSVERGFVYSLYNEGGQQLQQVNFTLPPLAERDIQAGHEFGEGNYLGIVQPLNGEAKYFAGISRYSSNSRGGSEASTYNYAFNLEARAGNGSSQFVPLSNQLGSCYSESNWIEVSNVRSVPVTVTVLFRDQSGNNVGQSTMNLNPRSQFHFNAGSLIPRGGIGSAKIDSNLTGSIIAQSLTYFHDCSQNRVQSAYAVQSRIAGQDVQTGSINSYLGMRNDLRIIGTTANSVSANVQIRPFGVLQGLPPLTLSIAGNGIASATTSGVGSAITFPNNAYGTVRVQTPQPRSVTPFVLRSRLNPDNSGRMDFAIPVVVQ